MDIKSIKQLLDQYDNEYYNLGKPSITDELYDSLKEKYLKLINKEEYDYVPESATSEKRFKHLYPVLSLNKVKINEDDKLKKYIHELYPCIIQNKEDGLSIVYYPTGEIITRGNGKEGNDITEKVLNRVEGVGKLLEYPVRGEYIIDNKTFESINKDRKDKGLEPYKNSRNAAAGILGNLDYNKIQGLIFSAYNILCPEGTMTAKEQYDILKNNGWNVNNINNYIPTSEEDAYNYIINFNRDNVDHDIDGLVIKNNTKKIFGLTEHHPKNAIAVKFLPKGKWTKLLYIINQVGRTGIITPVATFEPVNILGVTINNASFSNYDIIRSLGIEKMYTNKDIYVYVVRANDVIPDIIDVKYVDNNNEECIEYDLEIPTHCPSCNSKLVKKNNLLYCTNDNCKEKIIERLTLLANRESFDIDDLSYESAKKIVELYKNKNGEYPKHPSFIFELSIDDLKSLQGFADISSNKLYKNIVDSTKEIRFDKFLNACGIPLIGKKKSYEIANYYSKYENPIEKMVDDKYNDFKDLSKIKGIGKEIIFNFNKYYDSYLVPFGKYKINIVPMEVVETKDQLKFVITGAFEISKDKIEEMIKEYGHKVSSSVSKKTNYVLVGKEPGKKYDKAKELNIPMITSIEELKKILQIKK